jgi:hypothetical protein
MQCLGYSDLFLLKMSTFERFATLDTLHYGVMKIKELTLKQTFSVPCVTCGAAPSHVPRRTRQGRCQPCHGIFTQQCDSSVAHR